MAALKDDLLPAATRLLIARTKTPHGRIRPTGEFVTIRLMPITFYFTVRLIGTRR